MFWGLPLDWARAPRVQSKEGIAAAVRRRNSERVIECVIDFDASVSYEAQRPYNRLVDLLGALSRIVPFAFASGVNLYATVAVVGLSSRFGLVSLPEQFRVFENPWVIGIALAMYAVEFVADKVPWVD